MVSIIIPTFNYGKFLTDTLQSVKNQSYKDWECIVIDDGSMDNTRDVVNNFVVSDNRFKYIYQANEGVSSARNAGIKESVGHFIQFLDGDDLLQEDKIKSQVDAFTNYPNIDIVYNEVRFFDDGNQAQLRTSLNGDKPDNWMPKLSTKGTEIVKQFSKINFLVMNSPLTKKSVFTKVGFFDESMKALEDWDFWMRCALGNCYFYFNEQKNSLALVRVHKGSLSTEKTLMAKGNFMFLEHTLTHNNCKQKFKIILVLKYIELYWNSVFSKSFVPQQPVILRLILILSLPVYSIIKLVRSVK